jgi:hypothetical protein
MNDIQVQIAFGELHVDIIPTTLAQAEALASKVRAMHPGWEIFISSFNPHGYGSPKFRVYGLRPVRKGR